MRRLFQQHHANRRRAVARHARAAAAVLGAVLLAAALPAARACGPDFPSSYLETDGEATLPWIDFGFSLARLAQAYRLLDPGTPAFAPSPLRGIEAEAADFAARLDEPDVKPLLTDAERTATAARYRAALEAKREPGRPPDFQFSPGLQPALREFALYHAGAAWLEGHPEADAIPAAWSALLSLPARQRPFRTTWVLYMTGILHAKGGRHAPSHQAYRELRAAAAAGFRDNCGLAYASFNREYLDAGSNLVLRCAAAPAAVLFYGRFPNERDFGRITLDLQLRCRRPGPPDRNTLKNIAAHPVAREVYAAFCADRYHVEYDAVDRFLQLLPPQPLQGAERIAFLAFIRNDLKRTAEWLAFAPADSLLGLWLRAELHRRAGRYGRAADAYRAWLRRYEELTRDAQPVPLVPDYAARIRWRPSSVPDAPDAMPFFDDGAFFIGRPFDREIQARLGTTLVHKRDFLQALDGFLRAGAWTDAAYVAETLVSLDDLRRYVDATSTPEVLRLCSGLATARASPIDDAGWDGDARVYPDAASGTNAAPDLVDNHRAFLRYLLGRRLVREGRVAGADAYLPADLQGDARRLAADLATVADPRQPADTRALAGYNAARLLRWRGMELEGTELLPDSRYTLGSFFFGVNPAHSFRGLLPGQVFIEHECSGREETFHVLESKTGGAEIAANPDARPRAAAGLTPAQFKQDPPQMRFHYRLRAADLMLQAAALTTSPKLKAMALHLGGSWIRFRESETADRLFYKRLARECRGVDLGDEAARCNYFPQNLTPWMRQQLDAPAPPLASLAAIPDRLIEPRKPDAQPGSVAP